MEAIVPQPFLLNGLKHHLGYIRQMLPYLLQMEEHEFFSHIQKTGNSVTDFYHGELSCLQICNEIKEQLTKLHAFDKESYLDWLSGKGLYYCLTISDGSDWLMREGEQAGRYIHIHPGKHSLHSRRIKSRNLRLAMAMIYYFPNQEDQFSIKALNHIRTEKLNLSPVKYISASYKRLIREFHNIKTY